MQILLCEGLQQYVSGRDPQDIEKTELVARILIGDQNEEEVAKGKGSSKPDSHLI